MNRPLVSIIIPIYNVEKYLRRCVDSVLSQTYQNLEIILVDDGSPDNCHAICDEYKQKDSRVIVIHKENGGVSEALTKARLEVRDAQRSVDRNGEKVVCPKCGAPMRKRMCKRGVNAGQPFWSCSRYPECDGTRRYE